MRVSGKEVAEKILEKLAKKIKQKNLHPKLAIILANQNPASKIYVENKIKTAKKIGIRASLYQFLPQQRQRVIGTINRLNKDQSVDGIIIQYPVYQGWDFADFEQRINPQKDVDGFLEHSPYDGATALAVWEMLVAFSKIEKFKNVKDFLTGKKIVLLGKGKAAGGPIYKLLKKKGFAVWVIVKETKNPTPTIKTGDIIISATGAKNVINKNNLKKGSYVIGVGVGKEMVDGKQQTFGDIKEDEVQKIAKLYCPTIGGIGPLTIVSLLKNVVESAKKARK